MRPPNAAIAHTDGVEGVSYQLTVQQAKGITSAVRILVRTARGVRFLDLDKPRIVVGAQGEVEDVQVNYLRDCLYLSGAWLKLATGERLDPLEFRPPPLEDPNWIQELGADSGLNAHLVTVSGLDAGELVTLHARGLQLDVTADAQGQALVPALVGVAPDMREAYIERAARRPFTGAIRVQTVEFHWLAALGPGILAEVRDMHGVARIGWREGDRAIVQEYRAGELRTLEGMQPGVETMLNPQPLPPSPPDAQRLARAAGLVDVAMVQALPGADPASVAIVRMRDGHTVIVTGEGRAPRVTGRYHGPLVGMQVDGGYALARSGDIVHLYAVKRPEETAFNR